MAYKMGKGGDFEEVKVDKTINKDRGIVKELEAKITELEAELKAKNEEIAELEAKATVI